MDAAQDMNAGKDLQQSASLAAAKSWYQSRTVWGALIAIAAPLLHASGIDLGSDAQGQIADAAVTIAGSLGGLLALYGRLKADTTIRRI